MTKDDFIRLQEGYRLSNVGLRAFLHDVGMSFSQYNYWLCKYYGDVVDDVAAMGCAKGCGVLHFLILCEGLWLVIGCVGRYARVRLTCRR